MPTSAWYQGESLKRLLQGAAVGVVATLVVGFGWGGWMLGSSAKTLADSTANSAVVAAIAPICVDQFQRSADAANNLTALKKTDAWQQATFVEKGGWAMMPVARRSIPACRKPAPPFSAPRNELRALREQNGRRST
jgi:hypothetical protein